MKNLGFLSIVLSITFSACDLFVNHYQHGVEAFNEGEWELAIEHLEKVRKGVNKLVDRKDAAKKLQEAYYAYGSQMYDKGNWRKAFSTLKKVNKGNLNYGEAHKKLNCSRYYIAKEYVDEGLYDDAYELLVVVDSKCPIYEDAWKLLDLVKEKRKSL